MSGSGLEGGHYERVKPEIARLDAHCIYDLYHTRRLRSENKTSRFILKVPPALLKECEDAYVPQIVSIGPYHFRRDHLEGMETLKNEAVSRVLERIPIKDPGCPRLPFSEIEHLLDQTNLKINIITYDLCLCYDKERSINQVELVHMMVRDACFILEFFRCLFNESVEDCEDLGSSFPKFGSYFKPVVRSEIMKDLIKLDNQIPLFVLEEVLAMEMGGSLERAKSSLQQLLKAVFYKCFYRPFDYVASGESTRQKHILDIYYHCCLGDEDHREEKQKIEELQKEKQKSKDLWINLGSYVEDLKEHQSERHKVPSAVQLEKGGVKIQATGKTVQDIGFEERTLHIPPVELDSDSEIFIRNLIALEVCSPYGTLRRMTAFVQFLNELCQTEKGATLLRENGVIIGSLWQDSQVTRLFSSCTQSHSVPSYYPIEVTREKLMKYYSRKTRIAAAEPWNEFRKTYFSKPWIPIGGMAAATVLALTAIQVHCLYHHCGPPA